MNKLACELVDRRYLGALRFVDSTTRNEIKWPLKIKTPEREPEVTLFRNQSQLWVIASAEGLETHLDKFISPPLPPPDGDGPDYFSKTYKLDIADPSGKFLPRIANINLPRRLYFHESENIFTPIDVEMYPTPMITAAPNWSVIRVSIQDVKILEETDSMEEVNGIQQPKRMPVSGAWLRVFKAGETEPTQRVVSDDRGEAIILLPGLPVTDFSSSEEESSEEEEPSEEDPEEHNEWLATGPVVELTTTITISVVVDPELPWPVDPEELEDHAADVQWQPEVKWRDGKTVQANPSAVPQPTPVELKLKPGEQQTLELYVTLPNPA